MATTAGAKIVGYCRVSSDQQAKSGLGLDSQRAAITAEALRQGWDVVAWEVDAGLTGKNADRPALKSALRLISEGKADGLCAAKLDRIARSVVDFSELLAWFTASGRLLAVLDPALDTSTASGRLVANIFASVAEWEGEAISERTSSALASKRAAGMAISRPSVLDRPELVAKVQGLRAQGLNAQAIANRLNAEGVPTIRGGAEWRVSSVQRALGYKRPQAAHKPADLPAVPRKRTTRRQAV
jgi:DNA invertase Pin-like site-specific DNA recombinase